MANLEGIERTFEYELVTQFYADKVAARSKVYKIHHVTEGVYILNRIGASLAAKRAFCLHPMTQDDKDLAETYEYVMSNCDPTAVALALEYRNIANQYLSYRDIASVSEIKLSPIKHVNDMLVADKVQNYKDFLLYHKGSHPRSGRLDMYFKNWLQRLDISHEAFEGFVAELQEKFPDHAVTR